MRNSLETRYSSCEIESECQKPISKLLQTMCNINSAVIDLHLLLQDQDVNRLRQTVYRDLDDQKNSEFLALASVYLGMFSNRFLHWPILQPIRRLHSAPNVLKTIYSFCSDGFKIS